MLKYELRCIWFNTVDCLEDKELFHLSSAQFVMSHDVPAFHKLSGPAHHMHQTSEGLKWIWWERGSQAPSSCPRPIYPERRLDVWPDAALEMWGWGLKAVVLE